MEKYGTRYPLCMQIRFHTNFMANPRQPHPSADEYLSPPVGGYSNSGTAMVTQHKVCRLSLAGKPQFGRNDGGSKTMLDIWRKLMNG